MTLTRLVLAWLPVALEFTIVGALFQGARGDTATEPVAARVERELPWRSVEAAAVTLLASLWFDSLGHGGWWLLFLLLGVLVALADAPSRDLPLNATRHALRYLAAGAILAWRLG